MLSRLLLTLVVALPCLAQAPRGPNLEMQRAAMKKLEFLTGRWSGGAWAQQGPGPRLELTQTEDVQYKLDGLVLLVEGTGRNRPDGKTVFRALATISFDDTAGKYFIRAHNDGRYIEAELQLAGDGKGFTWGFATGPVRISYVMKLNEAGEWVETGEYVMGQQPPQKFIEMTVKPQR